jgi:uncharacterized membrane protein
MNGRPVRGTSTTLTLGGVGVAGYLTYVHYAGLHPVCGISHGCETVQTSSYAYQAGVPVALLGLLTYLVILVTLRTRDDNALLTGYVLTLIGFGFSLYLTYREVFTIHAICSWCFSSAIVFTLLAVTQTIRMLRAGCWFVPGG